MQVFRAIHLLEQEIFKDYGQQGEVPAKRGWCNFEVNVKFIEANYS